MSHPTRFLVRALCALSLSSCSDGSPTAPPFDSHRPFLTETGLGEEPGPEQLAQMPAAFATAASILSYWTDVGFIPAEQKAYGRAYMTYFATDGRQKITLSVRLNDRYIGSSTAEESQSDWLPATRLMFTSTIRSLSGPCGHAVDGQGQHIAFHKFPVDGWKFFTWGNQEVPSSDSDSQAPCPPSPPPVQDGEIVPGDDSYLEDCEVCQQWFWYVAGAIALEWWECTPEEGAVCQGAS
jgi:hypothetical protein